MTYWMLWRRTNPLPPIMTLKRDYHNHTQKMILSNFSIHGGISILIRNPLYPTHEANAVHNYITTLIDWLLVILEPIVASLLQPGMNSHFPNHGVNVLVLLYHHMFAGWNAKEHLTIVVIYSNPLQGIKVTTSQLQSWCYFSVSPHLKIVIGLHECSCRCTCSRVTQPGSTHNVNIFW